MTPFLLFYRPRDLSSSPRRRVCQTWGRNVWARERTRFDPSWVSSFLEPERSKTARRRTPDVFRFACMLSELAKKGNVFFASNGRAVLVTCIFRADSEFFWVLRLFHASVVSLPSLFPSWSEWNKREAKFLAAQWLQTAWNQPFCFSFHIAPVMSPVMLCS